MAGKREDFATGRRLSLPAAEQEGRLPAPVMKTIILRGIVLLILAAASLLAWNENRKPEQPAPSQVSLIEDTGAATGDERPAPPPGGYRNSIALFTYILFLSVAAGIVLLRRVIPAIGDRVAESFYSAPEKAEETATHKARALLAQGEYHKALAAFGRIAEENPSDRVAILEMARIYQERLGDIDSSVDVLEKALTRDWSADDKGFLALKLADIHATQRCDFARAREILNQLIAGQPGSNHAGNASHRLREMDDQEFLASRR